VKQKVEWTIIIPAWVVTVPDNKLADYSIKMGKASAYLRKNQEREDGIEEESEKENR
jgi:hypothetical protein